MIHDSWKFLEDLDTSERYLLSSAIDISGLNDITTSKNSTKLIRFLASFAGNEEYVSFLRWISPGKRQNSLDELEYKYLYSLFDNIIDNNTEQYSNKLKLAFSVLDTMGFVWDKEILNEIYLSVSDPENSIFIHGKDIRYSIIQEWKIQLLTERSFFSKLLLYLAQISITRFLVKNYIKNRIAPIVCAIIIIRNEKAYSFTSDQAALNYISSFVDGDMERESREMALSLLNSDTRYSVISKNKWQKLESFEKNVEQLLYRKSIDDGRYKDINWNYSTYKVENMDESSILAKRRHTFMHSISDDIKGVIDKLKRDCNTNSKLKEYKGDEILSMLEVYSIWRNEIKNIPLGDELNEEELKRNIDSIVCKGNELINKFSPFFHSLIESYAFLFPGYQDGRNVAYNRLIGFINDEEKLHKTISTFSSTKDYGKQDYFSAKYILALTQSSMQDVTNFITIISDYDLDNDFIKINIYDYQEYVLKNFQSNLKEKAFFQRDNIQKKILISVTMRNGIIAIGLSNNGEPFEGDVQRVFDEKYTHGKNKGSGQGMYDAKQYMNYVGGDIQMEAFQYMEYPVRFVLLFPIVKNN